MTVYRQTATPLPKNTHNNNSNLPLPVSPQNRELLEFRSSPALTIQGFKLTKYTKACQNLFSGWKASMWRPHSTVTNFYLFFLPPGAPLSKCFDSITAWNKHPSFTSFTSFWTLDCAFMFFCQPLTTLSYPSSSQSLTTICFIISSAALSGLPPEPLC